MVKKYLGLRISKILSFIAVSNVFHGLFWYSSSSSFVVYLFINLFEFSFMYI